MLDFVQKGRKYLIRELRLDFWAILKKIGRSILYGGISLLAWRIKMIVATLNGSGPKLAAGAATRQNEVCVTIKPFLGHW